MFIKQHELRIDPRLNRKLAQQTRAKTMNGGDDCAIISARRRSRISFAARFVNVIATI